MHNHNRLLHNFAIRRSYLPSFPPSAADEVMVTGDSSKTAVTKDSGQRKSGDTAQLVRSSGQDVQCTNGNYENPEEYRRVSEKHVML